MLAENPITTESELATIAAENLAFVAEWIAQNSNLSPLTMCVAAQSHASANHVEWRDIFCHECEANECLRGTAEQLAAKIHALGWIVENLRQFDVLCAACREVFA
jgi:hypothetical protein